LDIEINLKIRNWK